MGVTDTGDITAVSTNGVEASKGQKVRLERSASVEEREKKRRRTTMKRAETINFSNQV